MKRTAEPYDRSNGRVKRIEAELVRSNDDPDSRRPFEPILDLPGLYSRIGDIGLEEADGERAAVHVQQGNRVEVVLVYMVGGERKVNRIFPRELTDDQLEQICKLFCR